MIELDLNEHIYFLMGSIGRAKVCICIEDNEKFWDLPKDEQQHMIDDAKNKIPYAIQAWDWYFLQNHTPENLLYSSYKKKPHELLYLYENNPFFDDSDKENIRQFLEKTYAILAKKSLKRAPDKSLRNKIIERDGSTCQYCHKKIEDDQIHIDHVIPYSLGGKTEENNLVVSCAECNLKKSAKLLKMGGGK